jgi:hypothetical protein
MTALLWARPMFAAIVIALVGVYVWAAWKPEARSEPGYEPEAANGPTNRR